MNGDPIPGIHNYLLMRQEGMLESESPFRHPHECGFHLVMRQDRMLESASHFPCMYCSNKRAREYSTV
jgi:hypothetical protein